MRAFDEAGAFNNVRGEHLWFSKHLKGDAGSDNIHDGVHRADLMKMHLIRWQAMDFAFSNGNAMEYCDGFLLHPGRKGAARNEILYLRIISAVFMVTVFMVVSMFMRMFVVGVMSVVFVAMLMLVPMPMFMFMVVMVSMGVTVFGFAGMSMLVPVFMFVRQMDVELNAINRRLFCADRVNVITVQPQFFQLVLEFVKIHPQVNQRADKHIATDPAEDIEIKGFHRYAL